MTESTDRPETSADAPSSEDDQPVLPQVSRDERDVGWGEDRRERERDLEWYRRERPPHHE